MKSIAAHLWGRIVPVLKNWRGNALLAGALLLVAVGLNACSTVQEEQHGGRSVPNFDGDWRGPVKWVAGADAHRQVKFRIVIHGHTALAYEFEDNQWKEIADNSFGTVRYKISQMGDLYVVNWVNEDVIWTEEQTYSLSYVSPNKLKIVQLRHVTNRDEGKAGKPWFYVCTGTLTRTTAE